jgi:hypothetical protein
MIRHPAVGITVVMVATRWRGRVGITLGPTWVAAGGAGKRKMTQVALAPTAHTAARVIRVVPSSIERLQEMTQTP